MLSYNHIYHCGNLADVHKHYILSELLFRLKEKNKPISYIETHAGRALYNLLEPEAQKNMEFEYGINFLQNQIKDTKYNNVLYNIKSIYGDNYYAGSPMIAKTILDKDDSLNLMELHSNEYAKLKENMKQFNNVHVHNQDGYTGALSIAPTIIKRGIVLIDPPYEMKNDYIDIPLFIKKLHKKWSTCIIVLWYPILENDLYIQMIKDISKYNFPKLYQHEVVFNKQKTPDSFKLLGSGMIIINSPYEFHKRISNLKELFK